MATMRSTPPRRPRCPASVTRTSYQVGSPWMFEGKMLREAIGTPMRMKERAKSRFAEADPDPFTFANLTTKSLVRSRRLGISWPALEARDALPPLGGGLGWGLPRSGIGK